MRIAADGRWFHQGGEITPSGHGPRIFHRCCDIEDDGGYWLVTPHERLSIVVEDAPFIAVEMQSEGEGETTHTGLSSEHR